MKKAKEQNAITLIALVITIIVILILANVAINLTLGKNGIFNRAKEATLKYDISQYEEMIHLAQTEARMDKIENEKIIFLDRVQEILEANPNFKEAIMKRIIYEEKESLIIFIKDHAFVVNDDEVKYLGTSKDFNVPSADGNITILKTPDTEWTTKVIITAEAKESSYEIEYSIGNEENWNKYQETGIKVTENTSVYIRLNIANVYGKSVEVKVENIDDIDPGAEVTGMPTSAYVNEPKTAAVKIKDNESGLNLEECKWVYTTSKEELGIKDEDLTKYTEKLTAENQTITMKATEKGTWYLHVLVTDQAGNRIESISETGVTATELPTSVTSGTTFNYNGKIQSYTVPYTGVYQLEVWGGRGGNVSEAGGGAGGAGGYAKGFKLLNKGQILYICVGGAGGDSYGDPYNGGKLGSAGYNGGGSRWTRWR